MIRSSFFPINLYSSLVSGLLQDQTIHYSSRLYRSQCQLWASLLGYGMTMNEDDLKKVNYYRSGKHYSDVDAANMMLGSTLKKKLTKSPFVRDLEYGARKDGYWEYECMVLQLENCIDVLNAL